MIIWGHRAPLPSINNTMEISKETERWLAQFDSVENALGWRETHLEQQMTLALINGEKEVFPADDKVYMELLTLSKDYKVYPMEDSASLDNLSGRFDD
jgi:hypothetical protein